MWLSCRRFRHHAVRLQLHALAYNLANFTRSLAWPKEAEHWSLTTLRETLVMIGSEVIAHGHYVTFQTADVAVRLYLFRDILRRIVRAQRVTPTIALTAGGIRGERRREEER